MSFFPLIIKAQFGYNTNVVPVGEKEALMANTGVAGVNSVGAMLYNPAALTEVEGNSISFSGSAFSFYSIEVDPIVQIENQALRYSATGFKSIPSSIFMHRTLKDWKIGFSVIVPMSFEVEGPKNWTVPFGGDQVNILIDQLYKEEQLRLGLTAARKIGNHWALGITVYGESYQSLNKNISRSNLKNDPSRVRIQEVRESLQSTNLIAIIGLQKRLKSSNIGLSIHLPEIHVNGNADYFEIDYNNLDKSNTIIEEVTITNANGLFKSPLRINLGYAKNWSDYAQTAIDFSYANRLRYNAIETTFYTKTVQRNESYRLSIGQKIPLKDNLTGMIGVGHSPALGDKDEYEFYSFTSGLELRMGNIRSIVGFFYSKADGNVNAEDHSSRNNETYQYRGIYLGTNYTF